MAAASSIVFRHADLGRQRAASVRVRDDVVTEVALDDTLTVGRADTEVDCRGGALLPGLHDHHLHLFATAAAEASVPCGPPEVRSPAQLQAALRGATARAGWIRGVGYDDASAGPLDRVVLDAARPDVPVRVQHRSGALWVLNTVALEALTVADEPMSGIERDAAGRPTGRLWRLDGWLGHRLDQWRAQHDLTSPAPDLAALSRKLAAVGITGVTDATPDLDPAAVRTLQDAGLMQRVQLLGDPAGTAPWKIVVADHAAPVLEELGQEIVSVRPRPVALHCVTRVALVVALAALEEAGPVPGDRIEHAAVCPPELSARLAGAGVTVVTQPSLLARRGDEYLDHVDAEDGPHLWPFASLLAAGVRVGCASDAPYGDVNPWLSMTAARDRQAPSGRTVVATERVPVASALAGFLTPLEDPGGRPRTVRPGGPADLVMLDRPLAAALREPSADCVRMTMIGGQVVHCAGSGP